MSLTISNEKKQEIGLQGKFLLSVVDKPTITELMEWMGRNVSKGKREFTLLISSAGGSPSWACFFASFLRSLPEDVKLHGITFGECGSAALAILQFCHKRTAVRHTAFFPHHVQQTLQINCQLPMEEIFAYVEHEIMQSRMIERELSLIQSARMGITLDDFFQIADRGEKLSGVKYFTDEALKIGMIDEVIERYPLLG
jgi:ATP-dependent protease ClpP protease subunit